MKVSKESSNWRFLGKFYLSCIWNAPFCPSDIIKKWSKATTLLGFHGYSFLVMARRQKEQLSWFSDSCNILPILCFFLSLLCMGHILDLSVGVGYFIAIYSLHCNKLFISGIISLCWNKKLIGWEVRTTPIFW